MEFLGELLRGDVAEDVVADKFAVVDDDGTGAHGFDFLHDMGGEEHHFVAAGILDDGAYFFQLVGVETGGGLIKDEHLGVVDEGLCQAYALAVALGELADAFVALGGEANKLNHLFHTVLAVFKAIDAGREFEELTHVHVEVQGVVLRQIAYLAADFQGVVVDAVAADGGFALGWRDVASENLHEGGFAGTVGTEQTDHLTFLNSEADIVDSPLTVVDFSYIVNLYHDSIYVF